MSVPSRRAVVATALCAVAVLLLTWLPLRHAGPDAGETLPDGDHSVTLLRWGCLLADGLAVAAAAAALARLRDGWGRWPVGVAATWLAIATAAAVASEAGRDDWLSSRPSSPSSPTTSSARSCSSRSAGCSWPSTAAS